MKTSCINHPKNSWFIKIYDWQIDLMDGDRTAAALLSFFEYWHDWKLVNQPKAMQLNKVAELHGDQPNQDASLYQWHTEAEIENGIKIAKRTTIASSLKTLVERGYVSIHKNPNPKYKFDKTRHFLFHPDKVNEAIDRMLRNNPADPSTKSGSRSTKSKAPSTASEAAIPKNSSKNSSKSSSRKIKDPLNPPKGDLSVGNGFSDPTSEQIEALRTELIETSDKLNEALTIESTPINALAVVEKVPPRENENHSQIIKTAADVKPAITRAKAKKMAELSVDRRARHNPDAAEAWWAMFRTQALQADCKPGSKAEAIAAWDLLHEIGPGEPNLYEQIIKGTELYWERELRRDRPNCKHGVRFLEKRDWQEALDWADIKSHSTSQPAQRFAPFLACWNQDKPMTWPGANEADLSSKCVGRFEELISSCADSLERFQKALLWCKRDTYWGLERSLTLEEFLYSGKINEFSKKQIHAEKIGMDKVVAPDRKTIEAAAKKEAFRQDAIARLFGRFHKGELSKEDFRAALPGYGIDPDSVPEAC